MLSHTRKIYTLLSLFFITNLYAAETPITPPAKSTYFTKQQIENLNFELFLKPKTGSTTTQYLENLQNFSERLLSLAAFYKFFKQWLPIIIEIEENQDYRYPIKNPLILLLSNPLHIQPVHVIQSKWGPISFVQLPIPDKKMYAGWVMSYNTAQIDGMLSFRLQLDEIRQALTTLDNEFTITKANLQEKTKQATTVAARNKIHTKKYTATTLFAKQVTNLQKMQMQVTQVLLSQYGTIPEIELMGKSSLYAVQLEFLINNAFYDYYMHPEIISKHSNAIIQNLLTKMPPYNELKQLLDDIYQEYYYDIAGVSQKQTRNTGSHINFSGISETLKKTLADTETFIPAYKALYSKIINAINTEIASEKSLAKRVELLKYNKSTLTIPQPLPNTLSFNEEPSLAEETEHLPIPQTQKAKPRAAKSTPKKGRSRPKRKDQPQEEIITQTSQLPPSKEPAAPKTVEPKKVAPIIKITYAPRVERWFNDAFAETQSYDSVLYHSFSRLADNYLLSIGKKIPYANKTIKGQTDTQYSLLGKVVYKDGTTRLGIFHVTVDPKNVCYHRGITFNVNRDSLFQDYFKNDFWRVAHRADDATEDANAPKFTHHINEESFIEKEDDFIVKIRDNRLDVTLVLFKPAPAL